MKESNNREGNKILTACDRARNEDLNLVLKVKNVSNREIFRKYYYCQIRRRHRGSIGPSDLNPHRLMIIQGVN